MKLQNLMDIEIIRSSMSSLSDASRDNANGASMIDSEIPVICFDRVKEKWAEMNKCKRASPASNDVLFVDQENEKMTFVEFKNGVIGDEEKQNLITKNYDSIILLADISGFSMEYIRKHMAYVLVYNKTKNRIPDSRSYDKIKNFIGKQQGKPIVKFGLSILRDKKIILDINAYSVDEFLKAFKI